MTNELRAFVERLRRRAASAPAARGHAGHDGPRADASGALDAALTDPARIARQVDAAGDLRARFVTTARAAGAHVHELDAGGLQEALPALMEELGLRRCAWSPQSLAEALRAEVDAAARAAEARGMRLDARFDDDALFSADAGITGVFAAVAETGSLAVVSGAGRPRGDSLIPPVHVAIVEESQIVADLCDLYCDRVADDLPAALTLITGPSKTADIEGVLVTGMHGPRAVHVLLVPRGA